MSQWHLSYIMEVFGTMAKFVLELTESEKNFLHKVLDDHSSETDDEEGLRVVLRDRLYNSTPIESTP